MFNEKIKSRHLALQTRSWETVTSFYKIMAIASPVEFPLKNYKIGTTQGEEITLDSNSEANNWN